MLYNVVFSSHPDFFFFFFNDTATTEIYTLSLHDALPILLQLCLLVKGSGYSRVSRKPAQHVNVRTLSKERSEEHTSELQSQSNLVCRLLLEKKKNNPDTVTGCRIHSIHELVTPTTTAVDV